MTNHRKKKQTTGRKSQWPRGAKLDEAAAVTGSVWDNHSFADAMDEAGEELVYEPKATQEPRSLVYRLRLDEQEMASLQRLARERRVSISVILREFVSALVSKRGVFNVRPEFSALVRDPTSDHQLQGSFAHVAIANNGPFAARVRCWLTFLRLDGSRLFSSDMPARWSSAPEPISTNAVLLPPGQVQLVHYLDPSRMSLGYTQDFARREEQQIAVAIKFSDGTSWGWTQESYQHNWRHPSWRLPNELLRVQVRLVSDGRDFVSEFQIDCRAKVDEFAVTIGTQLHDNIDLRRRLPDVPYIKLVKP